MRELELQERLAKMQRKRMQSMQDPNYEPSSDSDMDQYLTAKERYDKRMREQSNRKVKGLTFR